MKKTMLPLKLLLMVLLLCSTGKLLTAQTTHVVNADGSGDYTTISAAVTAASSGDIIQVIGTITGDATDQNGIVVNKDLTIMGQGMDVTFVEASTVEADALINRRVFTIASGVTVHIKNMTIRHGSLNTNLNYDGGGGIKNSGILFLEGCKVTHNRVHTQNYQFGGGILTDGTGRLTIDKCVISNNTSSGWAGGICHGNYGGPGPLVLTNSTIHNNSAPGRAGALLVMICTQANVITNCTFYSNNSGSYGVLFNDRSTVTYTNNTFLNNTCTGGGGAIYLYAGTMTMKNNLMANNNESGGSVPNDFRYQSGTVNDNGYNLVENSANYTFTGTGDITGDQSGLNLDAGLADNSTMNGTQTVALLTGSVAIDAGSGGMNGLVQVPCKDQRGYFNNLNKDIGAFEFDGSGTPSYSIAIETNPTDQSVCPGSNVSFAVSSSNGLYYQWVRNGIDIPGATSATLSLNNVSVSDSGMYYCRVSDDCLYNNSDTAHLSISDILAPVPDVATLSNATGECSVTLTAPTATDNCAGTVTATTTDPTSYTSQGTHTVTWTYDDGNGNTSTQTQSVIVDDVTAPVPNVATLSNATGECSVILTAPTATDNCSGTITATTTDPTSYSVQGTYIVTWTYDDGNGNTSTQTQSVVVDDVTAPVPDVATLSNATGECSVSVTAPTATDNCSGSITATTTDPTSYSSQGTYTVTWTYDDGNGNTSTQTQTVIVDDVTAPVPDMATLSNATGECSASVTAPTATDNCSGSITATTTDPTSYSSQGTYTVTWTYDDGNGNTSTQTQTVIVDDVTAPVPDVATLSNATGECSASVTAPTATDNCSGSITATTTDPTSYSAQGTYTVTWTYDDGNGNTSTQTQTVIVDDVTAPVPDVATLSDATGECSASVTAPTATDNCSGSITATTTDPTSYSAQGTYTVTWTYDDGNGNTSTQTQSVIVDDVTDPVFITSVSDTTIYAGNSGCTAIYSWVAPSASDNCNVNSLTSTHNPGDVFSLGTTMVTYTATDDAGNTATSSFNVTVISDLDVDVNTVKACFGESNGTAWAMPTGGGSGYSLVWSPGAEVTDTITGLSAGSYMVTVTDAYGCTATNVAEVEDAVLLTATIDTYDNVSCNGNADGSATVTANGGTPGYVYNWSNSASTSNISGLSPGVYSVMITDQLGCVAADSITIVEPAAISITYITEDEISGNDGSIDVTTSGGTPVYTFMWSNGATTEDLMSLAGGVYTVTITDDNGCTYSESITVNSQLGVEESGSGTSLSLYPNPSNGVFTLNMEKNLQEKTEVRIITVNGKVIYTTVLTTPVHQFNLSGVVSGTYYLQVITGGRVMTSPFIISK